MCGIFGYYNYNVPKDRAAILSLLINGLRRLEYRGYDSAGVAVMQDNHVIVVKDKGRINNLEAILDYDALK